MKKTAIKKIVINQSPKAQASTEFLLILAAVLVITLSAAVITQQQFFSIQLTKAESDAKNTVKSLGTAALEVYAQGEGAKKQVFVRIPDNYISSNSYITNKSILLRAGGSDYTYITPFVVHGGLPAKAGDYFVWVISEGSRVRIGNALITTNKPAINIIMDRNSTRLESFSITNIAGSPLNITLAKAWNATNLSLSISSDFSLGINATGSAIATFIADENAVGFYNGEIIITARSSSETEIIPIPVSVIVLSKGSSISPPLFIIPSIWNATLLPNQSVTKEFQVCTNSETSVPYVRFSATAGAAGAWVSGMQQLPAIPANTCLSKIFNLSAPAGTAFGQYTGSILADGGTPSAQSSVSLVITVGGNVTDTTGPLVTNIRKFPAGRSFIYEPITITATADERSTGNHNIKNCDIRADGGVWQSMNAIDRVFDSPLENISKTFEGLTLGWHTVNLRCTDELDNTGQIANFSFKKMREILFVTKDRGVGGTEGEWMNWLNSHSSGEDFTWFYDTASRQDVINGITDKNLYSVIIIAEHASGSGPGTISSHLIDFARDGGVVVFFDKAVDKAPVDVGIATSGDDHSQKKLAVRDNSSYLTQGLVSPSNTTFYTSSTKVWHVHEFSGSILITDYDTGSHITHPALGVSTDGSFIIWGVSKPGTLSVNGTNITTRVIDYAIMNSTIG